jgi:hypothetical protein
LINECIYFGACVDKIKVKRNHSDGADEPHQWHPKTEQSQPHDYPALTNFIIKNLFSVFTFS